MCLISSLIVHDFSNKKLKKLYPDLKFISHFIRNISDLKLKMLFLICGTLLYRDSEDNDSIKNVLSGIMVDNIKFPLINSVERMRE